MGVGRLHRVVEFDVGELVAADDLFLLGDGNVVPSRHVVQVLLHDHVAAAGERGIFLADDGRFDRLLVRGVLGPVDEAEQVPLIEVAEPVDLVRRRDLAVEAGHDQGRQLEAEVRPRGADVKQEVPRRRHRPVDAADLAEGVQPLGPRSAEEPVPGVRADPHHAGEPPLEVAEVDGPDEGGEIAAQAPHGRFALLARVDRDHEENGGPREGGDDRL